MSVPAAWPPPTCPAGLTPGRLPSETYRTKPATRLRALAPWPPCTLPPLPHTWCTCTEQLPSTQPFVRCWTREWNSLCLSFLICKIQWGWRVGFVELILGWVFLWFFEGFGEGKRHLGKKEAWVFLV